MSRPLQPLRGWDTFYFIPVVIARGGLNHRLRCCKASGFFRGCFSAGSHFILGYRVCPLGILLGSEAAGQVRSQVQFGNEGRIPLSSVVFATVPWLEESHVVSGLGFYGDNMIFIVPIWLAWNQAECDSETLYLKRFDLDSIEGDGADPS